MVKEKEKETEKPRVSHVTRKSSSREDAMHLAAEKVDEVCAQPRKAGR